MKKVISPIFFISANLVFIYDCYFAIAGSIDVKNELDRLAATPGASGVDYWGVGWDILILGILAISIFGLILSLVSWRISQNRVIRIISFVLFAMFGLVISSILFFLICI